MQRRSPHKLSAWELMILLIATALLCLSRDNTPNMAPDAVVQAGAR